MLSACKKWESVCLPWGWLRWQDAILRTHIVTTKWPCANKCTLPSKLSCLIQVQHSCRVYSQTLSFWRGAASGFHSTIGSTSASQAEDRKFESQHGLIFDFLFSLSCRFGFTSIISERGLAEHPLFCWRSSKLIVRFYWCSLAYFYQGMLL